MAIKSIHDLEVYRLAYSLAMDVFQATMAFPKNEIYSLTDQIRRSSRSVAINIREGYAKRRYENVFIRHLNDAIGSSEETRGWLSFALDCGYLKKRQFEHLDRKYDHLNAMSYRLLNNWKHIDSQPI
ncbi:MAG TPA: four helix bundle protein [Desulfosarcina sp.]|nr:four helix bundle protein [Desulfosarcina sp.]